MGIAKVVSKKADSGLKKSLIKEFEKAVEEIKQIIIDEYDDKLMGFKVDRNSAIDYNMYRDNFISRLNEFKFIKDNRSLVTLDVPDMETFDFSDGLEIVETMMEGLSGIYVEVNEKEYLNIFGKKPGFTEAIDKQASPKNRIFLVRYFGNVRRAEKDLNKRFIRYPFSNTPPIDVLEVGNLFVENNIDMWVNNAIEKTTKRIATVYK